MQRRIVRVNDGNDSNVEPELVNEVSKVFPFKFYNTSIATKKQNPKVPYVLTVNPDPITETYFTHLDPIPKNLMFVRARVNMWNLDLIDLIVAYYTERNVPVILTFMAYFTTKIPKPYEHYYIFRKRTLNDYWAITTEAWELVMNRYKHNKWVHSCGTDGEKGDTHCRFCGNCIREYFATLDRMEA